jgi:hypothetical protein
MGMDKLDAVFAPMIKGKETVQKKKDFWQLDPISGQPVHFEAEVVGHFQGKWADGTTYKGLYVDVASEGKTERVFVGDAGELMKVERADGTYLEVEGKPMTLR